MADPVSFTGVSFPDAPLRMDGKERTACFVFPDSLVDLSGERTRAATTYRFKVTNPGRTPGKLSIHFKTDLSLAYIPHLVRVPPVYELTSNRCFAHFGLPSRVGLPADSAPSDAPLMVLFRPGRNQPATVLSCETPEKGVGMVLSKGSLSFTFLDGTERPDFDIEVTAVAGRNIVDALERYQKTVPYRGIVSDNGNLIWFIVLKTYLDRGGAEAFASDAEETARLGVSHLVIESTRTTMFGNPYWSPKNSSVAEVRLLSDILEISRKAGIRPLLYYNICQGLRGIMNDPRSNPELAGWTYEDANGWAQQKVFEKVHPVDVNWFSEGKPKPTYPFDTAPQMELRNPQWRAWVLGRIRFMLKEYPALAGTYIDVWPGTLPYFGACSSQHDHDYGEHEWWNAMDGFLREVRLATRCVPGKVLLVNDSRMAEKALASSDLILNEDYRVSESPEECFWQCMKARVCSHGAKPVYMFHHWSEKFPNSEKAEFFLACATLLGLGYCIWDSYHPHENPVEYRRYRTVVERWSAMLGKKVTLKDIVISRSPADVERLSYETGGRRVDVDFKKAGVRTRRKR